MTKLQIDRCAFLTSIIQFYKQIKLALERVQQSLICFLLCANATCVLHLVVLCLLKLLVKPMESFVVKSVDIELAFSIFVR